MPVSHRVRPIALALSLALSAFLPPALAQEPEPAGETAAATSPADQALRALYTEEWNWRQQEFAREKVEGRWQAGGGMPAIAPADWERRAAYWKQVLEALDAIPVAELSPAERINAAVFRSMVEADYSEIRPACADCQQRFHINYARSGCSIGQMNEIDLRGPYAAGLVAPSDALQCAAHRRQFRYRAGRQRGNRPPRHRPVPAPGAHVRS